jgi:hypothetical protein
VQVHIIKYILTSAGNLCQTAIAFWLVVIAVSTNAQQPLASRLVTTSGAPEGLLASRSAVFHDLTVTAQELSELQAGFQQIGIDAVMYLDADKVTAGIETTRAYSAYLSSRDIKFIILFNKGQDGYEAIVAKYNNTSAFVDAQQPAWKVTHRQLHELIMILYRDSWLTQKKQNFLINDQPESDIQVPIIAGRRSELYPLDLKTDNIAVVKSSDPSLQAQIEELLNAVYPYPNKIKFIDAVPEFEKDLRRQGMQFILHYVHCRGKTARDLLGYDITRGESAYGSLTFPNGTPQVKTIPVESPIYKFYIKHVESGNVFLGTRWDADESLLQAMKNHLMNYRSELKLN